MDVLVVEDEAAVRRAMVRALERAGFMVKAVDNGLAALGELQQTEFRALVCDVRLPFLEGKSFYELLRVEHPEQAARVLFVTGLAQDPPTRAFLRKTGRPFLGKPVEISDLIRAVRSVVSESGAPGQGRPDSGH